MISKNICGTIILNHSDGRKEFFVMNEDGKLIFPKVQQAKEKTALGSLLTYFNDVLDIDVNHLLLVELNSLELNHKERMPFYVFETSDLNLIKNNHNEINWYSAKEIGGIFENYEISGVPIF
ncbi:MULTISPECIES: hypothetical protein [unclassified Enterococcus]|uniref:hypothetical protein n=1 Tax=unclassified Enterococcus TaxID=2608891 RepID=UPI0015557591|nr:MULTISPECIES: hypothetical protein [unclassified Enterococcus]MBS7577013.1 hypothetical protein [Enterococcus sp. MMGLQ5-2]MBS7584540.1 hypothetical protein [Enterococcus sp. MMGLQ5-1]NPD12395.1 hypothetical protein [Enterococcus sp. MMGLQ5-1]NPD36847.1 hypothetical protein [Enterococcus sp. MMGLQ5-2]